MGDALFHHLRFRKESVNIALLTRGQLSPRKNIHDRPIKIEQRIRFFDLEIDTIVSKHQQQSLVSIVDGKTGYLWLMKCQSHSKIS